MTKYIIVDWAGNRIRPDKTFTSFDNAWDWIRETYPDEDDWQDLYVDKQNANPFGWTETYNRTNEHSEYL